MVYLAWLKFSRLSDLVVYCLRPFLVPCKDLPGSKELAICRREQEEDLISGLEFTGLSRTVVGLLLSTLGLLQVLPQQGHYSTHPLLHLLYMLHNRAIGRWLLFPGFPGNIQKTPGSLSKEQLEWGEASGSLGHFPGHKEYIQQHQLPVTPIFSNCLLQHPLRGLVEPLNQPVSLGVVDRGAEMVNLKERAKGCLAL